MKEKGEVKWAYEEGVVGEIGGEGLEGEGLKGVGLGHRRGREERREEQRAKSEDEPDMCLFFRHVSVFPTCVCFTEENF